MAQKIKINPKWDNLSKEAAEAVNAGTSYGKFKGAQYSTMIREKEEQERRFRDHMKKVKKQPEQTCINCFGVIPADSQFEKFCCKQCHDEWEQLRVPDTTPIQNNKGNGCFCQKCGKELYGRQKKFCSTECKLQYTHDQYEKMLEEKEKKHCRICDKVITTPGKSLYCSTECYHKAHTIKQKFYRAKKKAAKLAQEQMEV